MTTLDPRALQPQATAPAGEGMVTEAPVVGDRKRIDDALVSCAGLLRTLCHNEIGDTAAAELEYVRSCIIPAAAPAPGVVWQATEATDAMWEAARGRNSFAASYRAMIAAAPASPQPANPAQVTEAIRGIVEDALNSAIPEPWEVAEHATQRILAAIGAGGQAVAEEDALETIERELIDGLEVEINIGAENYTFNHRQLARRILSALSQPHPADERVVEALELAEEAEKTAVFWGAEANKAMLQGDHDEAKRCLARAKRHSINAVRLRASKEDKKNG